MGDLQCETATSSVTRNLGVLQSRKILKAHLVFAAKTWVEILVAVTLLGLTGISSGADDDKPTGKELIEKARMVSDIRTEGAPSFRMEGTFRITPTKGGKEIEGRYTEIWISKSKWRREVQTSSFRRLEVGASAKTWLADSGTDRPDVLGHASVQTTEQYLGCKQKLNKAVNDNLELEVT
jgi:hypothetical protein